MFLPVSREDKCTCRGLRLEFQVHQDDQWFMDPKTGKCMKLLVQAAHPAPNTNQIKITDNIRQVQKLCVSLFCSPLHSIAQTLLWPFKYFYCCIILLFWPINGLPGRKSFSGEYQKYLMNYWGQMWAARSHMEYSKFDKLREINPMPIPSGFKATVPSVTCALHPRKLVIYHKGVWEHCKDPNTIINYRFIAISYRQSDVFEHRTDEEGKKIEEEQKKTFIGSVHVTTLECGMQAYWLDLECLGKSTEEINTDVYRMADIYRGVNFTLITISKSNTDEHSVQSWRSWGGRVWTLPEALLSRELRYRIGIDGPVLPVTLHELANKAYKHYSKEAAIIM